MKKHKKLDKIRDKIKESRSVLKSALEDLKNLEKGGEEKEGGKIENMLRDVLTLVTVTSRLAVEFEEKDLVSSILDVALKITNTDAGSILLVDEEKEELYFSVVKGEKAEELKNLKVPMGKGIAGYVALQGEPMCVSDVREDEVFDSTISKQIDYETRSILAVPMEISERVIGVMEVINKKDETFSKNDIEMLSILAKQAAMAIAGNRLSNMIYKLFLLIIEKVMKEHAYHTEDSELLLKFLKETIKNMEKSKEYKNILEMTSLLVEISGYGPLKQEACLKTLKNFKSYVEKELEVNPFSLSDYNVEL